MGPEENEDGGITADVPEDDPDLEDASVEEQDDGSAVVTLKDEIDVNSEFYDNLAETWDDDVLQALSLDLLDKIENDIVSRKKRDEKYEEGIRRTGLGDDAPGGAQFNGASRVVHPLMAEACVDFSAASIKELFPPNGPVRSHIVGQDDDEKAGKASRKVDYMNWQLMEQIGEYRGELEQMLTQLPLGGSQYMKMYWNEEEKRPAAEAVFVDDIFLPYSASNFYTSPRITHRQYLDNDTFKARVASKLYRDVDIIPESEVPDPSKAQRASDKVEGRDVDAENDDGLREVYEVYVRLDEDDSYAPKDRPAPYVVTIDKSTEKVLAVYRNWEESDETYAKLDWIVEFQFIPWRGAYGVGLPHLIGGLSAALTGALRALLDSAHINNAATLLKLKGARMSGQSSEVDITGIQEIEGPGGVDDIRKLAMPMPFNPPSSVLFQLLGWLDTAAKGVVTTAEEKISDAGNEMAVGTAMALIEQGSKVFSSIHARMHRAQERCLKVLHRLNRMYMDDKVKLHTGIEVFRSDFEGPMDVIPVSDPMIFSETQRFAQIQAIAQRSQLLPQVYNTTEVERRILQMMRVQDSDKLLAQPPTPKKTNAPVENSAMMLGKPAAAFPDQDHLAHIKVHMSFLASPILGANPVLGHAFMGPCIEHVKQHISLLYALAFHATSTEAMGEDTGKILHNKDPEVHKKFDELMAAADDHVMKQLQQQLQPYMPALMQAMQMMQKMQPPPPMDPSQATLQVGMAEIQRKTQYDQQDMQFKQQQSQGQQQADMQALQLQNQKLQLDMQRMQIKHQEMMATLDQRQAVNDQDNETAMNIALLHHASAAADRETTGSGIDPGRGIDQMTSIGNGGS